MQDPKKAAKKSRRLSIIDMIVIFAVVIGMSLFYKLSVNRTLSLQTDMQQESKQKVEALKSGRVTFYDEKNHKNIEILVEVAHNEYQQGKGLMFREDMPENHGMFFTYEDELQRFFWMKNTTISLDIIFISASFRVVKIHKNTIPLSQHLYASGVPAQFALEVRAGFSERYKIAENHRITWEMLK